MKPRSQKAVRVAATAQAPVSRDRKQFTTLIKKLEAERATLASWKELLPVIAGQAAREYHPLEQTYTSHERTLMVLLDQMYDHKSLSKRDRYKLDQIISSTALELLDDDEDDELKAIYNRHSGSDYDDEVAEGGAMFKDALEDLFGMQVDDDIDLSSPEARTALFEDMMRQVHMDQQAEAPPARPKSKSALAREQKQAAEAERLQQTVRDIFRKLVSQLHPDRELDAAERQRKTALMQRVNSAYAANDLLTLLELQLEAEQMDQASLDKLSEERIKQYNKILSAQLHELEREIEDIEQSAGLEIGWDSRKRLTPQEMLRTLQADIAMMQARVHAIVADLEAFNDIVKLKAWLKSVKPAAPHRDDDMYC